MNFKRQEELIKKSYKIAQTLNYAFEEKVYSFTLPVKSNEMREYKTLVRDLQLTLEEIEENQKDER